MNFNGLVGSVPFWLIFPATCFIVMLFWEVGYRFGHSLARTQDSESGQSITTLVSIILGLVAFLLAFTFNMAATRFQDRRDVMIEDVNAIGTTYLRTETIAEPERSHIKALLKNYVENRINMSSANDIESRLARSSELQTALWQETAAVTEKDRSPVAAIFVTSMNETIDLHTKRITMMFQHRIPGLIWVSLYMLTILGIAAMGYQNGLLDHGRSPAVIIVTLMFAVVIFMIADLDKPGAGIIDVDQQPMIDLRNSMN
jgi:hypothetical protein